MYTYWMTSNDHLCLAQVSLNREGGEIDMATGGVEGSEQNKVELG